MDAGKGSVAEMTEPTTGYELKITRTFDAPRELVWKAWTDPEMAKHWMGPRGFQATEFVTHSQPGAHWHLSMEGHIPGTEQIAYPRERWAGRESLQGEHRDGAI